MKPNRRQSGLTLIEMTVTIAVISMLAVLAVPAIKQLNKSMGSPAESRAVIASALSRARNMAISNRKYVGIRFQIAGAENLGPGDTTRQALELGKASQYMIFIEKDVSSYAYGFKAIEGTRPIKLPDNTLVLDTKYRAGAAASSNYEAVASDVLVEDYLRDITTLSIVFSPAGKMVIQEVRVHPRKWDKDLIIFRDDEVFHYEQEVLGGKSLFMWDNYPVFGLGQEYSSREFWIAERDRFSKELKNGTAYTNYLNHVDHPLATITVNGYTGELLGGE